MLDKYTLKSEIKHLIEQIMDPSATDAERYELNAEYNIKLATYKQNGWFFDETYTRTGWKRIPINSQVPPQAFQDFANSLSAKH
jgi:hypothetical protein